MGVRYAWCMQSSSHFSAPDIPVGAPATTWTVRDVMALMESWYPAATAQSWDRVGLIVGDPDSPVRSILLALDPTAAIADQAVTGPHGDGNPYDMVITHHPLLLRGASFLPVTDPKGGVVTTLIRSGIALFNAHTNADVACDGVATALADLIGLRDTVPLEPCALTPRDARSAWDASAPLRRRHSAPSPTMLHPCCPQGPPVCSSVETRRCRYVAWPCWAEMAIARLRLHALPE